MNLSSTVFECSAPDLDSCPEEALPEFAFIGRSNVGKSSLLNLLAGQAGLARVSPTPGFTKLINFFVVNRAWRLVDLPGYGFAHVARKDKAKFNQAVAHYLEHRANLCCVFALIDSSLPPQGVDLEFVEWLTRNAVPFVIVFTKTDKATPKVVQANIAAFTECISGWFQQLPEILTCSATAKHGRRDLLAVIEKSLAAIQEAVLADASPPTEDATVEKDEDGEESEEGEGPVRKRSPKAKAESFRLPRPNPGRPW